MVERMEEPPTALSGSEDAQKKLCESGNKNGFSEGSNKSSNPSCTSKEESQRVPDLNLLCSATGFTLKVDGVVVDRSFLDPTGDSDSEIDSLSVNCLDDLSTLAELRLEECSLDSCSLNSHSLGDVGREWDVKGIKEYNDGEATGEIAPETDLASERQSVENEDQEKEVSENSEDCECADEFNERVKSSIPSNLIAQAKDVPCDSNITPFPTVFPNADAEVKILSKQDLFSDQICNSVLGQMETNCDGLHDSCLPSANTTEECIKALECSRSKKSSPINDSENSLIDIEALSLRHENPTPSVNRLEEFNALSAGSEATEDPPDSNSGSDSHPPIYAQIDRSLSVDDRTISTPSTPHVIPDENALCADGVSDRVTPSGTKFVTFCDNLIQTVESSENLIDPNTELRNVTSVDFCVDIYEEIKDNSQLTLEDSSVCVDEPIYDAVEYDARWVTKLKSASDSHSSRSSKSSRSSTVSGPWTEERLYEDIVDLTSSPSGGQSTNDGEDAPFFSRRLQVHRQLSSSDSWGSEDFESCSSNEDDEKTQPPLNTGPENFKQRLLRKREQWLERRQSNRNLKFSLRKDSKETKDTKETANKDNNETDNADTAFPTETKESRLQRWFSLRKSNYDVERKSNSLSANLDKGGGMASYTVTNGTAPLLLAHTHAHAQRRMPRLLEEDQESVLFDNCRVPFEATFHRRQKPPALPPMPQGLTPEQIKRRHIVASIVHSENNYVTTLLRLVSDYKKPLVESKPPILNSNKLNTLFYRVPEILRSHILFRIALNECVKQWDKEEKIGDVFVASFSNAVVLDDYSDFINNFSRAMDVAKQESKKKSAFADFLKMRQITSNDRLSFFGLMVKPIQRFPQFILLLQDLLKHTPQGHHDRMSLQLALTQLESLAEMLNERKREAEQYQAFRDTLKQINTKFALRGLGDVNRYLLKQDDVVQLEFNQSGMINKTKDRRLFLTNDLVICVSVVPKSGDDFLPHSERLSLKWAYPVADVEITDTSSSPTLSRFLAAGIHKAGSVTTSRIPEESVGSNVDNLVQEMNHLMHDYEVLSRISALVSTFKGSYEGLTQSTMQQVGTSIQRAIHQKDEQMMWVDACCLQFSIKTKDGKDKETFTFQTDNPTVKKDWIVELRLAQLALDKVNSPAWDLPDSERTPSTKMPLFVKALPVFFSKHPTEVKCGCYYTVTPNRPSRSTGRETMYLWLCSSDGVSSHLTVFHMQQVGLRELVKVDMTEMCISALQHVPALGTGTAGGNEDCPLRSHTVWMGSDSHRLLVYSGLYPERQTQLSSSSVPAAITTIKYHCDQVYVGLNNGSVQVYRRGTDGAWLLNDPIVIVLGPKPITALLPISTHIYASCGNQVHVIDCFTAQVMRDFGVQHDDSKGVFLMAHSGIGLWIAQEQSSTICLYHTETFRHLQDINVASNVSRMLSETGNTQTPAKIYVTSLIASKGLLWVGTNVGVALTIPLPRLEGIPIISGRANISFHAHLGPITFLLALQSQSGRPPVSAPPPDPRLCHELPNGGQQLHPDGRSSTVPPTPSARLEKQESDVSLLARKVPQPRLKQQLSSPVMLRRRSRESREQSRRLSKTLPRSSTGLTLSGSQECDVYGLCGALLNVQNYDEDSIGAPECGSLNLSRYNSMRRSDPELAIPAQLSTLDRRVRLKASRPRSLDLSTWSVDSRASSACTTASSGSEESAAGGRISPAVAKRHANGTPNTQKNGNCTYKRKENDHNRTLMVVMGGRGYINWQRSEPNQFPPNTKDAHIVVWEMKL